MRRLILYGVIIFQVLLIISLVRGIQLSRRSVDRISTLQESKAKLEQERINLEKEREYVQSPYYLEKVARDELHMSKPGETLVIVPDSQRIVVLDDHKPTETKTKYNWQRWLEVLSGKIP